MMKEKYPGAFYWTLPDDGAPYRCFVCGTQRPGPKMVQTQTPDGKKSMATCRECVDEDWLERAEFKGVAR